MTQSVPPRDIQTQPNVKINPPPNGIKSTDTKDPMFCHPLSKRMTSVPTDIRTTVPTSIKRTPKMVSPSIRVTSGAKFIDSRIEKENFYNKIKFCLLYYIKKKVSIPDRLKQKVEEVTKEFEGLIRQDV